ncbi:MAG: LysM peptidoglycan-binding domain-containing protein [Phycisphaerales bacterium JB059]
MDERASQVFAALSVLVLLWIAVYWLWEPSSPRVSQAETPHLTVESVEPPAPGPAEPEPRVRPVSRPGVIPPEFEQYTVREGDSFESIAQRHYGDASRWSVIARANPLKDPRRLRAGQQIRVPLDPDNVQGVAVTPEPEPEPTPSPDAPEPSSARVHRVEPGDTLSSIAKRYLGTSTRAGEIFQLNRDRLRDMHSLHVGQELRIPAGG